MDMKKVIYKSISMILAGILCVSILAGCSDAQSDGSKGAEKELSEGSVMKNAAILPSVTFEGDPYEFMTGEDYSKWWNEHRELIMQSADLKEYTEDFYTKAMEAFLTSEEKNLVCSPLNLYMALAILAETSEGETRSQVLELLGEETIDSLRTHASAVWQANYDDNPVLKCHLANSLWLNSDITYKEPLLDTLTSGYFADIFSGTMGTEKMDEALQKWTDEHTGGLLSEYISDIKTDPEAVMELISAIYFKATWIDKFNKDDNTTETFHGLNGDTECDMMHMSGSDIYFWGDRFTCLAESYSICPSRTICPSSTGQTPAMALSMVDLPAPLPPMIVTKSPSFR